jgi:thiaminase/transcriptional activator TenA
VDDHFTQPDGSFTAQLWSAIQPIFAAILDHPFIKGLSSGRLAEGAFRFYVIQDALYLKEFARALAVCAARAPGVDDIRMFSEHAAGAIAVERELHNSFLREFGMTSEDLESTTMAPTNRAYTSYLLAVCYGGSFPEAVAAVLPCYWIYQEVGSRLIEAGSPDPRYRRWIDTYGGEEFAEIVRSVLALTDRIHKGVSGDEEALMIRHFCTTARYEWMFWDMGYREEQWPI